MSKTFDNTGCKTCKPCEFDANPFKICKPQEVTCYNEIIIVEPDNTPVYAESASQQFVIGTFVCTKPYYFVDRYEYISVDPLDLAIDVDLNDEILAWEKYSGKCKSVDLIFPDRDNGDFYVKISQDNVDYRISIENCDYKDVVGILGIRYPDEFGILFESYDRFDKEKFLFCSDGDVCNVPDVLFRVRDVTDLPVINKLSGTEYVLILRDRFLYKVKFDTWLKSILKYVYGADGDYTGQQRTIGDYRPLAY